MQTTGHAARESVTSSALVSHRFGVVQLRSFGISTSLAISLPHDAQPRRLRRANISSRGSGVMLSTMSWNASGFALCLLRGQFHHALSVRAFGIEFFPSWAYTTNSVVPPFIFPKPIMPFGFLHHVRMFL